MDDFQFSSMSTLSDVVVFVWIVVVVGCFVLKNCLKRYVVVEKGR